MSSGHYRVAKQWLSAPFLPLAVDGFTMITLLAQVYAMGGYNPVAVALCSNKNNVCLK
jgi:hypothetical protein